MKSSLLAVCLGILLVSLIYADGQIDIAYSNYTISQPGSYVVVCDLTTGQNFNCITINTSNVTIDLNGHTLYGAGTTVGSFVTGIYTGLGRDNITITNGIVRDFHGHGIYLQGRNIRVCNVKAVRNKYYGIYVGNNATIKDNIAEGNGDTGIYTGIGCTVTGNSAYINGWDGIFADIGTVP